MRVDADPNTPGTILVTIASSTGPASADAQLGVEDYITARLNGYKRVPAPGSGVGGSPEEAVRCQSAKAKLITAGGLATVSKASLAQVKVEASRLWSLHLGSVDIGRTVYLAELVQAVMDAGASDFSGATLNGVAGNVNLAQGEVTKEVGSLADLLSWKPI